MAENYTSPPNRMIFNEQVWQLVRQIPAGKVASYGQIAFMIAAPDGMDPKSYHAFGARWVGGAMAACPAGVPWQRVVNAQGMISQRQGAHVQRELLEAEGVEFDERGRIDLKRYGWTGP
jgi:methylated-DNA-protein-cysteine methyltransferase-like protein